jgi:putative phosphoesterase
MIIGLLSDTHDNIPNIRKAIMKFKQENVKLVLHAGDYVSSFTAMPYAELDVPLIGVLGNNCAMTEDLKEYYSKVGGDLRGYFTEVEADGLKIALFHGHRKEDMDRAKSGDYDVIVQGHFHVSSVNEENGMLVVNPGEVCGYAKMLGLVEGNASIGFLDSEKRVAWISELV